MSTKRPFGAAVRTAATLLAVLAAAAPPAAAQRLQPGQTVLDRPRPAYTAAGLRLGGFLLEPALELRQSYVDNLLAEPDGGDADRVGQAAPELALRSDWPRHAVGLRGRARVTRHARRAS